MTVTPINPSSVVLAHRSSTESSAVAHSAAALRATTGTENAPQLGLTDRARFLGRVTGADRIQLLDDGRALLVPSRDGTFGVRRAGDGSPRSDR